MVDEKPPNAAEDPKALPAAALDAPKAPPTDPNPPDCAAEELAAQESPPPVEPNVPVAPNGLEEPKALDDPNVLDEPNALPEDEPKVGVEAAEEPNMLDDDAPKTEDDEPKLKPDIRWLWTLGRNGKTLCVGRWIELRRDEPRAQRLRWRAERGTRTEKCVGMGGECIVQHAARKAIYCTNGGFIYFGAFAAL